MVEESSGEMVMEGGPEALPEQVTLGPLASEEKLEAAETIANLTQLLDASQLKHGAVLGRYIELLRQREDVIPEMVGGATLDEVDTSLLFSQAAFERVVSRITSAAADKVDLTDGVAERAAPVAGGAGMAGQKWPSMGGPRVVQGATFYKGVPVGGAMRRGRDELLAEEASRLDPIGKILLGLESKQ